MLDPPLVIGPESIARIGRAVEQLGPWLVQGSFRLLANGNIEFSDPEPAEATRLLRQAVEEVVPEPIRVRLGDSSGLGWNVFFGHVVGFWLSRRRFMGFLRALTDRAALHGVELRLHWNKGHPVPVERRKPGQEALWWGGAAGIVGGIVAIRTWPADPVRALLIFAAGVVIGRLWQRVAVRRVCGDRLCQAPLGRRAVCPSCGGEAEDRR